MSVEISAFYTQIRDELPGCPDFLLERYAKKGVVEFCRNTEFHTKTFEQKVFSHQREAFFNDQVTISTAGLGSDLRPYSLKQLHLQGSPRECRFMGGLASDIDSVNSLAVSGIKYYHFPTQQSIAIFPVRESEFQESGELDVVLKLVMLPLETISLVDDQFFYEARDAVEGYVVAELARKPKREWTSPESAQKGRRQFIWKVNDYRIQHNLNTHAGSLSVRMRPFV